MVGGNRRSWDVWAKWGAVEITQRPENRNQLFTEILCKTNSIGRFFSHHSSTPVLHYSVFVLNIKSPPSLAAEQGLNGGWEFAMLSFPGWHWAPPFGAASFPTLFSTASGVTGLVAGPSVTSRQADY